MLHYVDMLLELTKEYESPTSFWKWSAYTTVAATLRNNIFFQHGLGRIYPNIYTLLLADSATSRKDAPLALASEILRAVGSTKVIEGRSTHQGITEALSYDIANKATGVAIKGGCAIILGPEFSAAFIQDPSLINVLTDWFDYRELDSVNLKMGKTLIKDRCINILASSNETLLKHIYSESAIFGGLIRRTFFIKPDAIRPPNSLFEMQPYDKKPLIDSLREISKLKGPITIDKDAIKFYDDWYHQLYHSYKVAGDKTGFLQSLHTSALKLAMIKTAGNLELNITKDTIKVSIDEVNELRKNYKEFALGVGKSNIGEVTKKVLDLLFISPDYTLTRRVILQDLWGDISADDMDKIIATLSQSGLIQVQTVGSLREPGYTLTDIAISKLG